MFSPSSSSSSEKKKKKKSTSIEAVPIRVLFPKSANARQRAILHEFAAKNGLKHYSIGDAENKTRRIVLEKLLNDEEKCSANNIVEIDEDETLPGLAGKLGQPNGGLVETGETLLIRNDCSRPLRS